MVEFNWINVRGVSRIMDRKSVNAGKFAASLLYTYTLELEITPKASRRTAFHCLQRHWTRAGKSQINQKVPLGTFPTVGSDISVY